MVGSEIFLYAAIVFFVLALIYSFKLGLTSRNPLVRYLVPLLVLCVVVGIGLIIVSSGTSPSSSAFQCPDDDPVLLGSHNVTFVVVDVCGDPVPDMLVECNESSKIRHAVTQADGSCEFKMGGRTWYHITIYNKTLYAQKEFDLYPVNSCYPVVLENV